MLVGGVVVVVAVAPLVARSSGVAARDKSCHLAGCHRSIHVLNQVIHRDEPDVGQGRNLLDEGCQGLAVSIGEPAAARMRCLPVPKVWADRRRRQQEQTAEAGVCRGTHHGVCTYTPMGARLPL